SPHSLHDALPSWRWSGDDGTCVHHLVSGVAASVVARHARSRAGIGGGMTMAHDPTRHWPLGVGPENTSIPGAAWLELLDGQAFPVVGAGAMVWNGTMWVPVSTQNRLPVDAAVSGTVDVSDRADRQLGKVTLSGSNLALRQTIVTGAKTVTSTAAELFAGAFRLSGRHAMVVTNTGADIVYIGAS